MFLTFLSFQLLLSRIFFHEWPGFSSSCEQKHGRSRFPAQLYPGGIPLGRSVGSKNIPRLNRVRSFFLCFFFVLELLDFDILDFVVGMFFWGINIFILDHIYICWMNKSQGLSFC